MSLLKRNIVSQCSLPCDGIKRFRSVYRGEIYYSLNDGQFKPISFYTLLFPLSVLRTFYTLPKSGNSVVRVTSPGTSTKGPFTEVDEVLTVPVITKDTEESDIDISQEDYRYLIGCEEWFL